WPALHARVAPSGLMLYRGSAFGSEYQGNLFSAQFNPHRVQRHVLNRKGEIIVNGKTLSKGYWKQPEETAKLFTSDGWLKTGDLGHLDENNRLCISAGRKKDLIIRAGENVAPLAIENALMNHPALMEAAVIGIPDDRLGEKVKACIVLREGATADEQELKNFCRERLPAFMVPDMIEFHDSFPKNATGKVLKNQLRES
ncbi:MAG: AMP-binding protein, partial [Nitrospinae bacterium]|nr:AMP-binding protein [Nitrospinota bacterium]